MRTIDNHVHASIRPCDVLISGWACIDPWKGQMAIKEAEHTEPEVVEKVTCKNEQRILGLRI